MSSLSDNIRPIIRGGRIIDLSYSFGEGKTKYKLYFRDSCLLLPDSLRKLAINFKVTNKGLFPYKFANNEKIALDYKGAVAVPTIEKKIFFLIAFLLLNTMNTVKNSILNLETYK